MRLRISMHLLFRSALLSIGIASAVAQRPFPVVAPIVAERTVGPYNVHVLFGGGSLVRQIPVSSEVLRADGAYTLFFWFEKTTDTPGTTLIAGSLPAGRIAPTLIAGPVVPGYSHFGGKIAAFTLLPQALAEAEIREAVSSKPNLALLRWDEASPGWPVQTRAQAGYTSQQDPSLMPHSRAPFSKPVAKPLAPLAASALAPVTKEKWTISSNWMLLAAPDIALGGQQLSVAGVDTRKWMRATVPGTVLTTMIDRGVYPDPDFD